MHEGHRERLRERYRKAGLSALAEHEVLELLLMYAIPRRNTNDIAHRLLERFGSLRNVFQARAEELALVDGIGEYAAVLLSLQGDVIRNYAEKERQKGKLRVASPADAVGYVLRLTGGEPYENVYLMNLDKNKRLLRTEKLFSGTLTEVPLYPRLIVEAALRSRAHSVILVHNHPSGDPTPSESDATATGAVKSALNSIDIAFFDHLVVGHDCVYSYSRDIYIDRQGNAHPSLQALTETLAGAEEQYKAAERE